MANRIQIRHGTGTPSATNLLPYELGWNGEALFINNNGSIKKIFGDSQSFIDLSVGNLVVTGGTSFINIPKVNGIDIALVTNIPAATNTIPIGNGTATVGVELNYARGDHIHPTDTTRAPLDSPGLTGIPTAPTATAGNNTTQIATTAFVSNATANYLPLIGGNLTGDINIIYQSDSTHHPHVGVTNSNFSNSEIEIRAANSGVVGIWSEGYGDTSDAKWLMYRHATSGKVMIPYNANGNSVLSDQGRRLWLSTTETVPSGAITGDIVFVKVT